MTYWWDDSPGERSWVEIRWKEGLGQTLTCGIDEPIGWWRLLDTLLPGDTIYHWQARAHRFVGRSRVASPCRIENSQRIVDLVGYESLEGPDRATLLAREQELVAVRDVLLRQHPGATLYLPFQHRADGIRFITGYFAKLPSATEAILFSEPEERPEPDASVNAAPFGHWGRRLKPYRAKSDSEYVATIGRSVQRRSRTHERLLDDFATWLMGRGFDLGYNQAIDLAVLKPQVIVEAKVVHRWSDAIRAGIGQLYEYRHFGIANPMAGLLLLVDGPVPRHWLDYLEHDRGIGAAWRSADGGFELSPTARANLSLS